MSLTTPQECMEWLSSWDEGTDSMWFTETIAHLRRLQAFDAAIADAFPPQRIERPSEDQARMNTLSNLETPDE